MATRSPSAQPTLALASGVLVLLFLWLGPLPHLGQTSFLAHMILHLGLVVVAGPLLGWALASGLPLYPTPRDAFSWCLLGSMLDLVLVWGWHVPVLHHFAATVSLGFIAEQACYVVAGVAVWAAAFVAVRSRATAGAAILALFLTFTHMTMFGLVLTLAPKLLYDPALCGGLGWGTLDDQRLGGVLMTVGGGIPYLAGTSWSCWQLLRS